ncbi:MAG: flagellar motor switch protein FliG [Chthoniobacteraceae bacterium]
MSQLDYKSLTKVQKTAAFMVLIGSDSAGRLLQHFSDPEVEEIVREMAKLPVVQQEAQRELMDEFTSLINDAATVALGGLDYVKEALQLARGEQGATTILYRAIPPSTSIAAVRELAMMEPKQVFNLIKNEQPQTMAFILSYLDTTKTAAIIPLLPVERRHEVVQRLADMDPTPLELIEKVLENLKRHGGGEQQQEFERRGGAEIVAQMLNRVENKLTKDVLGKIEENNSPLGLAIRRKMFTFEDFVRLSVSDLQRILRNVETKDMAVALKSANDHIKKTIFSSMSKRAVEGLLEEIDMLGPVRLRDVEAAQDRMIQAARALEEAGEITLAQEDADEVIN